ncbi:MAG: NUDIX domain-containing protein [Simkaniaceae bacterium]
MKKEFTATVYLFKEDQTLLHYHKKLQKWLPPGGHVEENETPVEAAIREVFEETGYSITLFDDSPLAIDQENAKTIPRPYLCLLEEIPKYQEVPSHQHIDFIYLAKPSEEKEPNEPFHWLTLDQIEALFNEGLLYKETHTLIDKVLNLSRV